MPARSLVWLHLSSFLQRWPVQCALLAAAAAMLDRPRRHGGELRPLTRPLQVLRERAHDVCALFEAVKHANNVIALAAHPDSKSFLMLPAALGARVWAGHGECVNYAT